MNDEIIREVYSVLESRRDNPIDSYTSNIMQDSDKKAEDKILEKIKKGGYASLSENEKKRLFDASTK